MTMQEPKATLDRYVVARQWDHTRAQWMLIARYGPYSRQEALQVKARMSVPDGSPRVRVHIERDRTVYWAAYHRKRLESDEAYRARRRARSRSWNSERMAIIRGEA